MLCIDLKLAVLKDHCGLDVDLAFAAGRNVDAVFFGDIFDELVGDILCGLVGAVNGFETDIELLICEKSCESFGIEVGDVPLRAVSFKFAVVVISDDLTVFDSLFDLRDRLK